MTMTPSPLISTAELADLLDRPDLHIVDGSLRMIDASWHLDGRNGQSEFDQVRLPGAVFFDLEAVSDRSSDLPHMLPSPADFAAAVGAMGIGQDDTIVVYDSVGLFSAARVWWTFRLMGARDVRVLDGGLPKWRAEGREVETGPAPTPAPAIFTPTFVSDGVADLSMVLSALTGDAQILDARPAARFTGQTPEPRPGLRSGHMPGALNVPMKSVLDEAGLLKRGEALDAVFRTAGIDPDRPIITTCGSGVTAAVLTLALAELGRDSVLYDGSWAEWGGRSDTPVAVAA